MIYKSYQRIGKTLYGGDEMARALNASARLREFEGVEAKRAGTIRRRAKDNRKRNKAARIARRFNR